MRARAVYDWIRSNTAACPPVAVERIWAVNQRVTCFSLPAAVFDLPFEGITPG